MSPSAKSTHRVPLACSTRVGALQFGSFEAATADAPERKDVARAAIALDLAVVKLLACRAAATMPRFAAWLGEALAVGEPAQWWRTPL